MSNAHTHWHFHKPGAPHAYVQKPHEYHGGGWHKYTHIHTRRVPIAVAASDEHVVSTHAHEHIPSEGTFHSESADD